MTPPLYPSHSSYHTMAKLASTFTLLSLLFAFALARTPSDGPENDLAFLDLSNALVKMDKKPFPSRNDASVVAGEAENDLEEDQTIVVVEGKNDDVEEKELEDQKPVENENDDGVVEAEKEKAKRALTVGRYWPQVNQHSRRPCHHWMKRMMKKKKAMRHQLGEFRGDLRREVAEEVQKPVQDKNDGVVVVEEDQKATKPETQILDITRPLTAVTFPLVINNHSCRHHGMKYMMRMRHRMHGGERKAFDRQFFPGEIKEFDREFFPGGERKEVDSGMGEFNDGERKEFVLETFQGGERKELDREMFHGVEGERVCDHDDDDDDHDEGEHHNDDHHDHKGKHHGGGGDDDDDHHDEGKHHDDDHHDHKGKDHRDDDDDDHDGGKHHDDRRRRHDHKGKHHRDHHDEEGEEEREEGGSPNQILKFITGLF